MHEGVGKFDDIVRFDDISTRFDLAVVRVRIYINSDAGDTMVGRTLLPLTEFKAKLPRGAAAFDVERLRVETARLATLRLSNKKKVGVLPDAGRTLEGERTEELAECWRPLELGQKKFQEAISTASTGHFQALQHGSWTLPGSNPVVQNAALQKSDIGSHASNAFRTISDHKDLTFSIRAKFWKANSISTKNDIGQVQVSMLAHKPERELKKSKVMERN